METTTPSEDPVRGAAATAARRLCGLKVGVTASRRGGALVAALEREGANVTWAPTLAQRGEPQGAVVAQTAPLLSGEVDCVAISTGDGVNRWLDAIGSRRRELVVDALAHVPVLVRGRKAAGVLARGKVPVSAVTAAFRNRDLAALVSKAVPVPATVLALVDGVGSPDLVDGLRARGYGVVVLRPSRCTSPEDVRLAEGLVVSIVTGRLDVVSFTSPMAVHGLFEIASGIRAERDLVRVLGDSVAVATIGPATAAALASRGVAAPLVAPRPRTGSLVDLLAACMPERGSVGEDGGMRIAPGRRSVDVGGTTLRLSPLEFSLAVALRRRAGSVCPTDRLVAEVWPAGGDRRRLEVLVSRLRQRLDGTGVTIESVRKRGYRLVDTAKL